MKEKMTINEYLQEAKRALERENFDDVKRNLKEYLDRLEDFTGQLFMDLNRILLRRFPASPSIRDVSRGYFFTGDLNRASESITVVLVSDNSSGSTPLPITVRGLFAPRPWVLMNGITTTTLNGTQVDPKDLSDIVLRQPTRVEAIRFVKDPNMTVDEFLSIQVKYQFIGIWGQSLDETSYSLSQFQNEYNYKDSPLTVPKGLVLDGNTGITLENLPPTPVGQVRRYILVLYASSSTAPGKIISGEKPITPPTRITPPQIIPNPTQPIRLPGGVGGLGSASAFDEDEEM